MKKRDFKPEFKQYCCRQIDNDGKTVTQVCKEFDLDRQTLHRWLSDFRELGKNAFTDKSLVTASAQVRKLERENRRLEEEIEILKKAIAYCAQKKDG